MMLTEAERRDTGSLALAGQAAQHRADDATVAAAAKLAPELHVAPFAPTTLSGAIAGAALLPDMVLADTFLADAGPADSHPRGGSNGPSWQIAEYFIPSDTLFGNQWHLNNTGQSGGTPGVDLDVVEIWDEFTGAGVTVGIWDDGVQYTHPDLDGNYDTNLHIIVNGNVHDPLPESTSSAHGTAVAGVIAAENDGIGTVGVAFGATIAGVDIFYDSVDDFTATSAMTSELYNFDVTNHSWGFTAPFAANLLDSSTFWANFFAGIFDSTASGRGGLGTINMVAAGNDRQAGRDSNDSNFTAIPQTIAIAAVSHDNMVSYYSTPGAANLVAGPTNGPAGSGIWTTDRTGSDGYSDGSNQTGNTDANYTATFGGTSSATPAVSGLVALMLEANPDLGWRDVQDILAMTARHAGTAIGAGHAGDELYDWGFNGATTWNGGGMHFSNDYGFGLVSAHAAVRLAETWTEQDTNANWVTTVADTWTGSTVIPDADVTGISFTFTVTSPVMLEHVGLRLDITDGYTGDYRIRLTSPDGTVSELSIPFNGGDSVTDSWFYMSNAFRGETGVGDWTVTIADEWAAFTGTLTNAQLEFYGSAVTNDDTYVFTDEYATYAGLFGHTYGVIDTNGGNDSFNLAATTTNNTVDLTLGLGNIAGVVLFSNEIQGIENVIGGDGNDSFTGSADDNFLDGNRGNDTLYGAGGEDALDGDAGDDWLYGGAGDDGLSGGAGDDRLFGGTGHDLMSGFDGVDRLIGDTGNDYMYGGTGADVIDGNLGNDTIYGGDAGDSITGGDGLDVIYGEDGNDTINAGKGHDYVDGGVGDDSIIGGAGNDTLFGLSGDDTINGNDGVDLVFGEDGNDVLSGGLRGDSVYGGNGVDLISGNDGSDYLSGDELTDTINGGNGNDQIYGGQGADFLTGDQGLDSIYGGDGNDAIYGGQGHDLLEGGAGDDTLTGGLGNDTFGGTGNDIGNDVILDFDVAVDVVRILGGYDAGDVALGTVGSSSVATLVPTGETITFFNLILGNLDDFIFA